MLLNLINLFAMVNKIQKAITYLNLLEIIYEFEKEKQWVLEDKY